MKAFDLLKYSKFWSKLQPLIEERKKQFRKLFIQSDSGVEISVNVLGGELHKALKEPFTCTMHFEGLASIRFRYDGDEFTILSD